MERHPRVPVSDNPIANPLCIILVKNGSKGDRLLFRYPYDTAPLHRTPNVDPKGPSQFPFQVAPFNSAEANGTHSNFRTPPMVTTTPATASSAPPPTTQFDRPIPPNRIRFRRTRTPSWKASSPSSPFNPYALREVDDPVMLSDCERFTNPGLFSEAGRKDILSELSDKDLSNLLAVNTELSERKFELKVNELRFVGHPTLMHRPSDIRPMNTTVQTSIRIFHIVFCLHAMASHSIVKCFHDLSKRLGIGLRHEEYRCGYLSREMKSIITTLDEACQEHSDDRDFESNYFRNVFQNILNKNSLAQLLKQVYDDVCETGFVKLRVNNWVQISFCLPQKIHVLPFRTPSPLVEPENIHKCLESIRPYHSILLIVDREELVGSFGIDASSSIPRLLQVYSPLKSLQTMAADADLTLSHCVEIASHLVYWAMATVIYPICETNVYVVADDVPITSSALEEAFLDEFPGLSLIQTFADFSLPMPLGERINPVLGGSYLQAQVVQLVCWLLRNRLLIQLHTFTHMLTYLTGDGRENSISNGHSSPQYIESSSLQEVRPYEHDEEDDATEATSDSYSEPTNEEGMGLSSSKPDVKPGADQDFVDGVSSANSNRPQLLSQQSVEELKGTLADLTDPVRRAVAAVKAPISPQDVKMFARLSKYFTGEFHFEEIMYRENVRRSQLLLLLDKFRDVLFTCEKEDANINFFKEIEW